MILKVLIISLQLNLSGSKAIRAFHGYCIGHLNFHPASPWGVDTIWEIAVRAKYMQHSDWQVLKSIKQFYAQRHRILKVVKLGSL
ncbi:hypothetical protein LG71_16475 [Pluralibacter gergoviae]|nr:hypothetical protein LG71_16475 [Pluralibacter gergoviae]